jgi:hypothetical protein
MEHIGKHLEKAAGANGKIGVQQGNDNLLVGWALQQGIIEPNAGGGFRLVITGGNTKAASTSTAVDDEEDAEGEVDDD